MIILNNSAATVMYKHMYRSHTGITYLVVIVMWFLIYTKSYIYIKKTIGDNIGRATTAQKRPKQCASLPATSFILLYAFPPKQGEALASLYDHSNVMKKISGNTEEHDTNTRHKHTARYR